MSRKSPLPLSEVYGLLEPGPVVLLATAHKGRRNVMTMSWHTMMEFEPPLVGCVVARSHYSHELLRASRGCTINLPSTRLAEAVVGCGNTGGRQIDKFAEFGLRTTPASLVEAPLLDACHANLECRTWSAGSPTPSWPPPTISTCSRWSPPGSTRGAGTRARCITGAGARS